MSWKTRFLAIMTLTLSALFLLPMAAMAAPAHSAQALDSNHKTTTASFAFTGLINKGALKGTPLTGGLTLNIEANGNFKGNLNLPGGAKVPVNGNVTPKGKLSITFQATKATPLIKGQGTLKNGNEFTGPFQVFTGKKEIACGIWSALAVANPSKELALAFVGKTVSGPEKGTQYSGALLLDSKNLTGTLNLPTGAIIPVKASLKGTTITVTFDLGKGLKIVGTGHPIAKGLKGFEGPYVGPASKDKGTWVAPFFNF